MRSRFIHPFLLTVVSLVIPLLAIELLLRTINYPSQGCQKYTSAQETEFDSILGWRYLPNQVYAKNFGGIYAINSEGYRAANKEVRTNLSKPLILIVGDSFLFGHGLNYEETFGYKLEKIFDNKYEIVNFSAQGYGTDQLYLLSQKLLQIYHPVAIITNYLPDHDLRNVTSDRRELFPCLKYPGTKPMFDTQGQDLKQVAYPIKYEDFDGSKLALLISHILKGDLKKLSLTKGSLLSYQLLSSMKKMIEQQGVQFYLLVYDGKFVNADFENRVMLINTLDEDPYKYHIKSDGIHPNAKINSIISQRFANEYQKDLNPSTHISY